MQPGDTILILPSYALTMMRLEDLVGREATVVKVVYHQDRILGCWAQFSSRYLEESEWFVPYNSIGI